ncbi:MAG TPA: hypothetical protein VFS02_20205, partial [Telluria sp.]|nr:hypothetical protein [Telluria sp.]
MGKKPNGKFTVGPTRCDCHPETCCCNPWSVLRPDGTTLARIYQKENAEEQARLLNEGAELRAKIALLESAHAAAAARAAPGVPAAVMEALTHARTTAMRNTVEARIPECGDFGAIAQNLDWAIDEIGRLAAPATPAGINQQAGGAVAERNANVAMLAARLVADHSNMIRTMFCDGAPTGRMLVDCLSGAALVFSAVQHAIHNLREHQAGRSLYFPPEAIDILERALFASPNPALAVPVQADRGEVMALLADVLDAYDCDETAYIERDNTTEPTARFAAIVEKIRALVKAP